MAQNRALTSTGSLNSMLAESAKEECTEGKGLKPSSFGEKNFYSVSTGSLITALSSVRCEPRWSIRGKPNARPSKEKRPEPPTYSPTDDTFSAPAPRLDGSLIREPVKATNTPAANCYPDHPLMGNRSVVYAASPQHSFYGGAYPTVLRKWAAPGPGSYPAGPGALQADTGKSFGKAIRFEWEKRRGKKRARSLPCCPSLGEESPGPGCANVPQDFDPPQAWITTDKGLNPPWGHRTGLRPDPSKVGTGVPGPGAYTVPSSLEGTQATIKMKVNRAPRPQRPGPADYDQESDMGQGPSFTMRARTKFGERAAPPDGPGPDAYNIEPGEKWINADVHVHPFSYTTRSRPQDMTGSGICDPYFPPGPGMYGAPTHPRDSCIKSPALPRSKRDGIPQVADSGLAPSHYDQVSVWDGPSISMMPRRPDPRPDQSVTQNWPGAAHYVGTNNFKYTWNTSPSWGSPSRTAKRGEQLKAEKKPGPGEYKTHSTLGKQTCSFHKKLPSPKQDGEMRWGRQDEMTVQGPESQQFTNFGYERN